MTPPSRPDRPIVLLVSPSILSHTLGPLSQIFKAYGSCFRLNSEAFAPHGSPGEVSKVSVVVSSSLSRLASRRPPGQLIEVSVINLAHLSGPHPHAKKHTTRPNI